MGHIAHHNVGNMPVTSESQTKATLALQGFTQKKKKLAHLQPNLHHTCLLGKIKGLHKIYLTRATCYILAKLIHFFQRYPSMVEQREK
jgi:hypothetical protein